jgi:hypothetical protein
MPPVGGEAYSVFGAKLPACRYGQASTGQSKVEWRAVPQSPAP